MSTLVMTQGIRVPACETSYRHRRERGSDSFEPEQDPDARANSGLFREPQFGGLYLGFSVFHFQFSMGPAQLLSNVLSR